MDDLIVGPLQEGGVDGHHGDQPFHRQTGGEGDAVLLRDADIEKAVGIGPGEFIQAGAVAHGGRDGHDAGVFPAEPEQGLAEHPGVGNRGGSVPPAGGPPRLDTERGGAMKSQRFFLGMLIPLALFRQDMHQYWALHLPDIVEIFN